MDNDKNNIVSVWVNPLKWIDLEFPSVGSKSDISDREVVDYLCIPDQGDKVSDIINRYKEISTEGNLLALPPADEQILEKLVWPLRAAKASYMTGNFLGTIALCGMVAEMIAVLSWEISDTTLNGQPMSKENEKGVFGKTFDMLGQERRINVLFSYGIIDKETKDLMYQIKALRNPYLHSFSKEHLDIRKDAVTVFTATVKVVSKTIGQEIRDGKLILNPNLLNYIKKQNAASVPDPSFLKS